MDHDLPFAMMEVGKSNEPIEKPLLYALEEQPIVRISIRLVADDEDDYWAVYYGDIPNEDIPALVGALLDDAIDKHGEDWFEETKHELYFYLTNEFEITSANHWGTHPDYRLDDFPDAAKRLMLIAFKNPAAWKRMAVQETITRNEHIGHLGHHVELTWEKYNGDPGVEGADTFNVRLLNSWENKTNLVRDGGYGYLKVAAPKEYVAYSESFF